MISRSLKFAAIAIMTCALMVSCQPSTESPSDGDGTWTVVSSKNQHGTVGTWVYTSESHYSVVSGEKVTYLYSSTFVIDGSYNCSETENVDGSNFSDVYWSIFKKDMNMCVQDGWTIDDENKTGTRTSTTTLSQLSADAECSFYINSTFTKMASVAADVDSDDYSNYINTNYDSLSILIKQ